MDQQMIDELVEQTLEEHGCPGCSIGIVHNGRSTVGAYGLARTDPATAFRADTRVPVASMTKPFTATAVMALVESGAIELDAPVQAFLPGFRVADPEASAQITVRHLLRHAGGWTGDVPEDDEDRGAGALAASVATLAGAPQVLPPGAAFAYSNSGLVVAGRLVEVVTGEVFEDVVERRILRPLGMGASTFFAERVISAPAAAGHKAGPDGEPYPVQDPWLVPRSANPAGGLISTAADQLAWLRWWLGTDSEADEAGPIGVTTRKRMLTELVPVGIGPASAALGWHVKHEVGGDVVYHEGRLSGSATLALFVPGSGLGIVVLTNADTGELVHRAVAERLLAELAGITTPEPDLRLDVDAATVAELVGSYTIPQLGDVDEKVAVRSDTAGRLVVVLESEHDTAVHPDGLELGQERGDLFRIRDGLWRGFPAEFLRTDGGALLGLRIGGRVFRRT